MKNFDSVRIDDLVEDPVITARYYLKGDFLDVTTVNGNWYAKRPYQMTTNIKRAHVRFDLAAEGRTYVFQLLSPNSYLNLAPIKIVALTHAN